MDRREIRRRTMGTPQPIVGIRVEILPFDEREAKDLDLYGSDDAGRRYRSGELVRCTVHRLSEACPCCGPASRGDDDFFFDAPVRVGFVPLEEVDHDGVLTWIREEAEYEESMIRAGLDCLERKPPSRRLSTVESTAEYAIGGLVPDGTIRLVETVSGAQSRACRIRSALEVLELED